MKIKQSVATPIKRLQYQKYTLIAKGRIHYKKSIKTCQSSLFVAILYTNLRCFVTNEMRLQKYSIICKNFVYLKTGTCKKDEN